MVELDGKRIVVYFLLFAVADVLTTVAFPESPPLVRHAIGLAVGLVLIFTTAYAYYVLVER